MAFREIIEGLDSEYPIGTSARFKSLDGYERMLKGTLYQHIAHAFDKEYDGNTYIPMRQRRPAVIFNIASIITNQVAGLMFGDEQAPTIRCWNRDGAEGENPYDRLENALEVIIDRLDLEACMMESVVEGSVGSCAIVLRSLPDKSAWWDVIPGKYCRPVYADNDPRTLIALSRIYNTTGQDLLDAGYDTVDGNEIDANRTFWMRVVLDKVAELCYLPLTPEKYQRLGQIDPTTKRKIEWVLDAERSFKHPFEVVPAVWVTNLIGKVGVDGPCTFASIVDLTVEIDYMLSQIGRGFRYSADPLLAISRGELAGQGFNGPIGENTMRDSGGKIAKTASNVIELETGAKAAMLEIAGTGLAAARDYVKMLREYAMEVLGGLKSDAEHEKGVQSGRALEMLYETLKLLVKRQRVAYGNRGLIPLLKLVMHAVKVGAIEVDDVNAADLDVKAPMRLIWPQMITPHGSDLMAEASALQLLAGGSMRNPVRLLATDTVTRLAANSTTLTDANAAVSERQLEDDEEAAQLEKAAAAGNAPEPDKPPRSAPARIANKRATVKADAAAVKAAAKAPAKDVKDKLDAGK